MTEKKWKTKVNGKVIEHGQVVARIGKVCKEEGKVFDSWAKNKKKVVCINNKLIHFGDSRYEDYTQHKDKKRRASFRSRHNCDEAKDKTNARYWACKELW